VTIQPIRQAITQCDHSSVATSSCRFSAAESDVAAQMHGTQIIHSAFWPMACR